MPSVLGESQAGGLILFLLIPESKCFEDCENT